MAKRTRKNARKPKRAGRSVVSSPRAGRIASGRSLVGRSTVDELLQQAVRHHQAGLLDAAKAAYEEALRLSPQNARLEYNLANCLWQAQKLDEAIEHFRRAAEIEPDHAEIHAAHANALSVASRFDESLNAARHAVALQPDHGPARYLICYALEQLNQVAEALDETQRSIAEVPKHWPLQILLAHLLARRGQREKSIAELKRLLNDGSIDATSRQRAWHELAMVLDQEGRFAEAYRAFVESGRLTSESPAAARFDPQDRIRQIRSYRAGVKPCMFGRIDISEIREEKKSRLAFLVGFPRSGTTMTEQVLAAHSKIATGDEWPLMTNLARGVRDRVGANVSPAAVLNRLSAEHVRELRAAYWRDVESRAPHLTPDHVFVDKMPLNIINLGLINIVFPEARVIVALRDPRDVCLSCFMQDFRLNHSMVHFLSLESTAAFYADVMDLYLFLREVVSLELIEVRYEDTVRDLGMQSRRILDHLGIEWDESVLRFHENAKKRMISTPSAAAVREPMHTRAVARWKNYEQPISAIMPKLDRFVQAFGYGDA